MDMRAREENSHQAKVPTPKAIHERSFNPNMQNNTVLNFANKNIIEIQ
jgi:hypothetical protein